MKTLIKASAALLVTALYGCNWDQPTPPCAVGHGGYSAKYTYVSGATSGTCFRKGDIIGVQKYRQGTGEVGEEQHIYLRPEAISLETYGLPGDAEPAATAFGVLDDFDPNADGFCTVPTLSPASGEMNGGNDDLTYTFSNLQFYVQGAVPGTQFSADLTITGAACTTTYRVDAAFPVVFCNDFDNETNPGAPNQELCGEVDHVWSGYAMNPGFDVTCAPVGNYDEDLDYPEIGQEWNLCVPTGPVPSLL